MPWKYIIYNRIGCLSALNIDQFGEKKLKLWSLYPLIISAETWQQFYKSFEVYKGCSLNEDRWSKNAISQEILDILGHESLLSKQDIQIF